MTLTKTINKEIPIYILVLIRSFFAFLMILPLAIHNGFKKSFKVKRKKLIALRMINSVCAISCTYFAYRNLPLATATSIGFSGPLFSTTFAILILREKFPLEKWIYLLLGYIGVLVIIDPSQITFELAILSSIMANTLAGIGINLTKILTKTEKTVTLILYGSLFNFSVSACLLLFLPIYLPTWFEFLQLFFIGGMGAFSSFCYTQSLRYSSPTFVAPFEYTRILYAIPVGYVFFSELPGLNTFIGAAVIVVAITLLNIRRQQRFKLMILLQKNLQISLLLHNLIKNEIRKIKVLIKFI